ncbi:MAG: RluA family pseudouridine synthase [Holosporales bacterium]|jgi:23S rRNA pseudouridine955/2504/2580 synthase|nr:RluA family pseudouridine synthase [Holosporales bacterium]
MSLTYQHFTYDMEVSSRLDRWLKRKYNGCTQGAIEKAIRARFVRVNGEKTSAGTALTIGTSVSVEIHLHQKWEEMSHDVLCPTVAYSFDSLILDETADFLILNKPSGLDVQGGSHVHENIDDWLRTKSSEYRLVHRIDRATSGLLIVAKSLSSAISITQMFRIRNVKKCYRAIVVGELASKAGEINLPIANHPKIASMMAVGTNDGKDASTNYRLKNFNPQENWSDVELFPLTGRKHQLRLHMSAIGHPIIGDDKYGGHLHLADMPKNVLLLHAWRISLPAVGLRWEAPLPTYWPNCAC